MTTIHGNARTHHFGSDSTLFLGSQNSFALGLEIGVSTIKQINVNMLVTNITAGLQLDMVIGGAIEVKKFKTELTQVHVQKVRAKVGSIGARLVSAMASINKSTARIDQTGVEMKKANARLRKDLVSFQNPGIKVVT